MTGRERADAARRRNAQKSTGPKTPGGKARSASNARRHGLSRLELDPSAVLALYRAILDDPSASPPSPVPVARERERVAWRLAMAELRLRVVQRVFDDWAARALAHCGAEDGEALMALCRDRARILRYRAASWRLHAAALSDWHALETRDAMAREVS